MTRLFKLLTDADRAALSASDSWAGSAADLRDGFIHLCTEAQCAGVRARYYAGVAPLWLAQIDAARLGDALRWEPATGGEDFPHLYAPLPAAAVVAMTLAEPLPDA